MSNFAQNSEDWDDSLILQVFNNAIARHSTKKQQVKSARDSAKAEERDVKHVEDVTGKRKREDELPPPKLSLKGMLDSYSARNRPETEKNLPASQAPTKEKQQKVHFHFPAEESNVPTSSTLPPSSSHFVEAETEPTTTPSSSTFTHHQSSQSIHPLVNDALQNMLMAWYHSGYATGRYEALLELNHLLPPVTPTESRNEQICNQR